MELNDLLRGKEIEPGEVLVLRHRPTEPDLNKILPLLAADKPDLFNAYQQTQGETLEKTMLSASYVASFIGHEPGKALYVGLYRIGKTKPLTVAQYLKVPEKIELIKLGMKRPGSGARRLRLRFDLQLMDFYSEWKGKLIVDWPPPERSWWRRAHKKRYASSCNLGG